jgi:cysteine desulfurase
VLKALGVGDDLAHSSIRFGLGRFNTAEEVEYVITAVVGAVARLREMNPLYEMERQAASSGGMNRSCAEGSFVVK